MKHVMAVFERIGFTRGDENTEDWDVLWAHDYPFVKLANKMRTLEAHQKVYMKVKVVEESSPLMSSAQIKQITHNVYFRTYHNYLLYGLSHLNISGHPACTLKC